MKEPPILMMAFSRANSEAACTWAVHCGFWEFPKNLVTSQKSSTGLALAWLLQKSSSQENCFSFLSKILIYNTSKAHRMKIKIDLERPYNHLWQYLISWITIIWVIHSAVLFKGNEDFFVFLPGSSPLRWIVTPSASSMLESQKVHSFHRCSWCLPPCEAVGPCRNMEKPSTKQMALSTTRCK